jgi:saccharopine dehydrogenase-like NADP-dependent oxidoreductase
VTQISIIGAGRSSWYLIQYLAEQAAVHGWQVLACDFDPEALKQRLANLPSVKTRAVDASNIEELTDIVSESAIVVSMLPPNMHTIVAEICLSQGVHMATASYVSAGMMAFDEKAKAKGLVFLNEMGLDPGIDHLSAMKVIHDIRKHGGVVTSFESHCGGLVYGPDCGDNPWEYKFSWNPRNVVLAAQGGMSVFRKKGATRYLPWHRVFGEAKTIQIPGLGAFDSYANRDSLGYEELYGLQNASTLLRGTLRREGYCKAWNALVQLGLTESTTPLSHAVCIMQDLVASLTGTLKGYPLGKWLVEKDLISESLKNHFDFLDLENCTLEGEDGCTAADLLQDALMVKWSLEDSDRDEVVMYHRIGYTMEDREKEVHCTLSVIGEDAKHTAMAKTVGLPLAMGVELILLGKVQQKGVVVPVTAEWYEPILKGLAARGVFFAETVE